jgi:RND family efflux transporter MFP subunit
MNRRVAVLVIAGLGLGAFGIALAGKISQRLGQLDTIAAEAAQKANSGQQKPAPVLVQAESGPATETLHLTGTLRPEAEVDLAFKLPGRVTEILVRRGDVVRQGDVLARIDGRDLEAQAAQARAGMKAAQAQKALASDAWKRSKSLAEAGAASDQQLAMASGQHDLSGASIAQAEAAGRLVDAMKAEARLVAPIDGVVVRAPTAPGFFAAPGMPHFRIERLTTLKFQGHLGDREAGQVQEGGALAVVSGAGIEAKGTIDRVIPSVDPATHRVPIEATVPNGDGKLFAGSLVEAGLEVPAPATVAVPKSALVTGEKPAVLRLGDGQRLVRVTVRVRRTDGERLIVEDGLNVGDTVLANPGSAWREGDVVPPPAAGRVAPNGSVRK